LRIYHGDTEAQRNAFLSFSLTEPSLSEPEGYAVVVFPRNRRSLQRRIKHRATRQKLKINDFLPVSVPPWWKFFLAQWNRMKVTDKDVAYVAELANLELTADERARMLRDLNSILEYVGRLNELNTDNVEPMAQVSERYGTDASLTENASRQGSDRFAYGMREDVKVGLRPSLPHEEAIKNAPETDGTFFEVPKVIER
jgi:aspartyl-tRNA(Asn)/glutamyl-tRNA(Gln) amidotransferase subunit C